MMSNMSSSLRDIGASGVRVPSRSSGKAVCSLLAEYRRLRSLDLSKIVKSHLAVRGHSEGCVSAATETLSVWSVSSLGVHYTPFTLTGVVSAPVYKFSLTAPTGRGVTKRPA